MASGAWGLAFWPCSGSQKIGPVSKRVMASGFVGLRPKSPASTKALARKALSCFWKVGSRQLVLCCSFAVLAGLCE